MIDKNCGLSSWVISTARTWELSAVNIRSVAVSLCSRQASQAPITTSWISFTLSHLPQTMSGTCGSMKSYSPLILLMEDAWDDTQIQSTPDTLDIQAIKDYLDENFKRCISLDNLAGNFYLNK